MSEYKLIEEIISRSDAKTWDEAKLEWYLEEVYREDEPDTCLCDHYPINEICILRNVHNGNRAMVGNVCVKKFLGLPSDRIFQAIRRVRADEQKALNAEAIDHAHIHGWITDWEREFYFDTMRKQSLSEKQMKKRLQVNRKILQRVINTFRNRP